MIHYNTFSFFKGLKFILLFSSIQFLFSQSTTFAQKVQSGIDILQETNFIDLKGKSIGIITNPTGVNQNLESTIDLLHNEKTVHVKVLYSPEHGIRGDHAAGDKVGTYTDKKTGLKVYSLYGKNKKPNAEMLKNIDALVYDIQDIGVRSYTYISTMGLAMEACAENNIELIVLDRPNPIGGLKVEGNLVDPAYISFVSQFPIPYVYGLTCGELANYINNEGLLKNGNKCKLSVIKMKGWKRNMLFSETNLPWVPTSPHIPNSLSAAYYPISGILGELYTISIGVGYTQPFELFAAEWINADDLANNLNNINLPGVLFRPIHYKPYYSVGKGKMLHGIQVHFTDLKNAPLSLLQFYVLQECHKLYPDKNAFEMCGQSRLKMFDKVCGSKEIRIRFTKNFLVKDIEELWTKPASDFKEKSKKYWLYN
ncbi:exo-beta-N-acetylmuramidase NamZ family protein [Marinifilum sp. RC60d5]|uniref:exo-beta-N-acetylmuramidase NamZ family protein n=1 Tax=Marinifilum sp. RC60d5 TaxID=3458414 RepID=UPI004036885E